MSTEDEELASLQAELRDKKRKLDEKLAAQKQAELEESHRKALRSGSADSSPLVTELAKEEKELRKKIAAAKAAIEARETTVFRCVVPSGARPKRSRDVVLVVSAVELDRIRSALLTQERLLMIGRDTARLPESVRQDADVSSTATAKLIDYLDECCAECGIEVPKVDEPLVAARTNAERW